MATTKAPTTKRRTVRPRTRRISLAFMGPDFVECYLDSRYLGWDEAKAIDEHNAGKDQSNDQMMPAMYDTVKAVFYGGQIIDVDGQLIPMEAGDIDGFDLDTIGRLYGAVLGVEDPKAPGPGSDPSSDTEPVEAASTGE